jgi:CubicO group peptidase (beta-lactamase class C family)
MAHPDVEVDPAEVGLSADRLDRLDRRMARYVDEGLLPGFQVVVARGGRIAHHRVYGHRDVEAALPVEHDTIFRIFSMTKPITSVAAMMLWEEGAFELTDPVHRYLPAFKGSRVYTGGPPRAAVTVPATEPIRIWHLLSHTSGLTYGFHFTHPVDSMYRHAGFLFGAPRGVDLAGCCDRWAELPLLFEPGTAWNYSVSTDVLGRLVEVLSGQDLATFFAERILGPLGMADTAFFVPEDKAGRLAALYWPSERRGRAVRAPDGMDAGFRRPPRMLSGGGGLVSTAADYHRFVQCLARGGALDDTRLLSPRTLSFMTRNHLPGGRDLAQVGRSLFAETLYDGIGFGLGFSVVLDPVGTEVPSSPGEYAWGGAASTAFWVDPVEDITVVFMTQLLPSDTHPLRSQLRQLVAQSIVA